MTSSRAALVLFALIVASFGLALGDEPEEEWQPDPPPPMPEKWDWIKLVSDEWLKGELIVMYDDKIEFDSDEMDMQTIDLEDVKEIRTGRIMQVRFLGNIDVTGKLYLSGDKIRILGEQDQTFDRDQILSITAGVPKEINFWTFKLTLGVNIRSGNTEQTEINSSAKVMRRTVENRIVVDYRSAYNVTDNVVAADNQRGSAVWDKFINQKFFVKPIFGEYFSDPFTNIDSRITVGVGAGYQIMDTKKTEWQVSGGPGYQRTRFDDIVPGSPDKEETPALAIGTLFDKELTGWIDFIQEYRFQLVNMESGTYNHHWVTTFETEITSLLDFDISFVWDRIRNPRQNSDGTFPEQDDLRLILSLAFDW